MEELIIPVPVSYSPLKHHFIYQLSFIKKIDPEIIGLLKKEVITVGNNATDVYCGKIPVGGLCNEILKILSCQGVFDKKDFKSWLGIREYRILPVSDGSRWVVRLSENPERFVHIHPGKRSTNSFRLRGTTLKTVIAVCAMQNKYSEFMHPDLSQVNKIRKEILELSPVKDISANNGILKWISFYREKIQE